MTDAVGTLATWLLLVCAAAVALLLVALVLVRWVTGAHRRGEANRRAQAMPLLLDVLDGRHVPVPPSRRTARSVALTASELVHKVRGADRDRLAAWLTEHGFRDAALRAMRARWAPRRARAVELYLASTSGQEPEPVVAMLRDRHPRVRLCAVRALGDSGARAAVPALVAAAGSRRRPVPASAAAMAIVRAAPSDASALRTVWTSTDTSLIGMAITICGRLGLVDARLQIEHLLDSSDARVRTQAIDAIGRIGDPRSAAALLRARGAVQVGSAEQAALARALASVGAGLPGARA